MANKPTERLTLPTINGGAGKAQTLQEWHAAGGGVPLSHKHKPHVWKAKVARMAAGGATEGGLVHMADGGDPRGEMKATPRNKLLGTVADAIKGGHEFVSKPFGYRNPPAEMISEFLGIPAIGRTVDRLSYGEPITNAGVANVPLVPSDLGETAMTLAPFVPAGARMAVKGAKAAGRGALSLAKSEPARKMVEGAMPFMGGPLNVVKNPGGNFLTGDRMGVDYDLKNLRTKTAGGTDPAEALRQIKERYTPEEMSTYLPRVRENTERVIQTLEGDVALNNWVDRNLSNYVKKQMGTPEDPVRKLAEEGITHKPEIVNEFGEILYDVGQQRKKAGFPREGMGQSPTAKAWEHASDEAIVPYRAGDIQDAPIKMALEVEAMHKMDAAGKALNNKFMEQLRSAGVTEREASRIVNSSSFAEKVNATGDKDFAKAKYEYYSINHNPNGIFHTQIGRDNPYISKLDPETTLYSAHTNDLGFRHITDVLREDVTAGRIRPEQLQKVSMEQAVRRTYEYDQELAAKMNAENAARREGLPVYKEYPEKFKWVELNKPGSFAAESDAMGHSVRGYEPPKGHPDWIEASGDSGSSGYGHGGWEAIKSGRAKVYSLVDEKGTPHTTVEVLNNDPYPVSGEAFTRLSPSEKAQYREHVMQWRRRNPDIEELTDEHTAQALKEAGVAPAPGDITQIKGKQNRAPKDEYLPYVQDFVTSGNWNRVGDPQNAGMRRYNDVFNVNEQRAIEAAGERVPDHEYLTGEEIQRLHNSINEEGKRLKYDLKGNIVSDEAVLPPDLPSDGMAHGGAVHMAGGGFAKGLIKALLKNEEEPVRKFSKEALQSTTDKILSGMLVDNPKMPMAEAVKKASTQAERKLTWEREKKPELVKQYGALERAASSETNLQKMRNTREVVENRIRKANEFLDVPTEPWTPPRPELQAFDRSSIRDALEGFPGVEQTKFPRDIPKRASTSHVDELYTDPINRELIKKQIVRGLPLGGETFYASLYPVKQAVLEAGMPAEKFEKWVHSLAPASARNSILNENAVGQFLRNMHARGIPLTEENVAREMAAYKDQFGIGLPLMPVHRQGVANVLEGGNNLRDSIIANIPTNYKIPTYGAQKSGDFGKSVVLDVHEAAGQTQGSRFHPYFREQGGFGNTEYNAGEQGLMGIADELGIPGGMAQAGRWFGGGELTGLRSPRGDALDLLEKQVAYTLKNQGIQPNPAMIRKEILKQIETGEGTLLPWFKNEGIPDVRETGLQRKEGGLVHMDEGGDPRGEMKAYDPTIRERMADAVQRGIEGLGGNRYKARQQAQTLMGGPSSNLPINMGIADVVPFLGTALGVNEGARDLGEAYDAAKRGDYVDALASTAGAAAGLLPGAIGTVKVGKMAGRNAGALASKGIDAIKVKPKNMASSDTLAPLVTEAKTASAGKPTGVTYATKQEGPFYRVRSTALDPSDVSTRGFRETTGSPSSAAVGEGSATVRERLPKLYSDEELAGLVENNQPLQIAKQYTKEQHGIDYGLDKALDSSLAKQSAIGRTHMLGVEGSPEYKTAIFNAYARQMPDVLEKANAKNYDDLLEKAYRQLAKETDDQFHRLPVSMSYHRAGEGNYAGANDMAKDVHGNRHLYVFQGGEPHDFLKNVDPLTGLNENEKFRAVHDFFGHAIHRNQFGPKGEEYAWNAHRQMYSPLAQLAMTIETRGQNSLVNYTPLNAKLKGKIAKLKEVQQQFKNKGDTAGYDMVTKAIGDAFQGFQFAPQKAILLPPEFISPKYQGGMPDYVKRLITPEKGTETQSALTHFSNEPNLRFTDPTKYGTGIKGAEAERLLLPGSVRDRSHFYLGEPESVKPEANLGVNRYRGESSSLYDLGADPLDFKVLARESNRTPFEAKSNKGITYPDQDANDIERLVKEYGYEGLANPNTPKPMAIMFDQVPVERRAKGGLASIK